MNSLYVLRTARRPSPEPGIAMFGDFVAFDLSVARPERERARARPRSVKVGPQAVPTALAAEARLAVAAERAARVESVVGVGPHHAGPHPLRQPEDPAALLGPDTGRQPVRGVVRLGHRLLGGAERE